MGLTIAAVLLLIGGVALSAMVHRQATQVESGVVLTAATAEANMRTLGQAQREALRLLLELETGAVDRQETELLSGFVAQRLREASLPVQLATYGDPQLLERAQSISDAWPVETDPLVEAYLDQPTPTNLDSATEQIRKVELELNTLISDAEIQRRVGAASAEHAALNLLTTTQRIMIGLFAVVLGLLCVGIVAGYLFWRFDRQRAVTRRELAELDNEARTLSLVARRTDNLVVITDARGRIEWVNEAFTTRTGYSFEDAEGRSPGELLQGPDTDQAVVEVMRQAVRAGQPFHVEVTNYDRAGAAFWTEIDAQPVHDDAGQLTNFIAVQVDVTEHHQAEAHLVRMKEAAEDVAAAKSNFLASMSHEIRTPLNAVLGLTELLMLTDLQDIQHEYASTAHDSGVLLLEILNNILDFSALESGRVELDPQPFDVEDVLGRVTNALANEADRRLLALEVVVSPNVPSMVVTDSTRLQQVVVNLVSNAIKFTEQGSVDVSADWADDRLTIEVRDSGIGIPPHRLQRVFEPFSQADGSIARRFGGTGLGLPIARHLAEMLGGSLTIRSTEGVGTIATLVVPAGVSSGAATVSPPAVVMVDRNQIAPRILVAEDDAVNRQVVEHMLRRLGYRADFVVDGAAAIDACSEQDYDLVLMDVQMPEVDGVEATRHIRANTTQRRQPLIVALTASALVGDRERFISAGMDGYLSKPVQLRDLADAIDEVCTAITSKRSTGRSGMVMATKTRVQDVGQIAPIDMSPLLARLEPASVEATLDVLVPVFLGQMSRSLPEIRSACRRHDAATAARLIDDAAESGSTIEARNVVQPLRLAGAAVRAERWSGAERSLDSVSDALDALRSWYVDRSIVEVAAG